MTMVDQHVDQSKFADELTAVVVEHRKPIRQRLHEGVPVALVFVGFIGLWLAMSYAILPERQRFKVPPPHRTFDVAFLDAHNRNELFEGIKNTGKVALIGFVVAVCLAFLGAVGMALARGAERAFFPWAVIIQTVPVMATTPLFTAWFKPGVMVRVIVTVLVSFFPILTSFLFGLKSADRGLHDLMTLHGANWWTRLRKVQLPAALPSIFTGLRVGAGLCVIGALVADFFFTRGDLGLGRLVFNYSNLLAYERLFGAIILSSILGVVIYLVIGAASNRVLRSWHESAATNT